MFRSRSRRSAVIMLGALVIPITSAIADDVTTTTRAATAAQITPTTSATPAPTSVATPAAAPTVALVASSVALTTAATIAAPTSVTATSLLDEGRLAIAKSDWSTAVARLTAAAAANPKSADAENLLGFSLRKSGNLQAAFPHYANALRIDPTHRGALEYLGEAYLQAGRPAQAKQQLAKLAKICGKSCEQYLDLSRSIAAYKPVKKK